MNRADQALELRRVAVVAREQDDAPDQGVTQQLEFLGRGLGPGQIDHQRPETHARARRVSRASDSTCAVCGNIPTTPAASRANPCSCTNTCRSRARLPGWQEIYNTRRGASAAIPASTARAPVRGGSSSTSL